jgi:hypothetical protein
MGGRAPDGARAQDGGLAPVVGRLPRVGRAGGVGSGARRVRYGVRHVGLVVDIGLAVRVGHPVLVCTAALGAPCRRLSWSRSGVGSAADARKRTGADRCRS